MRACRPTSNTSRYQRFDRRRRWSHQRLIGGLPNPADALRPLTAILETVEMVSAGDPSTQIQALLDRVPPSLSGPRDGGFLDLDLAARRSDRIRA